MKNDILGLEIVVDDLLSVVYVLVEVFEPGQDLADDGFRLLFAEDFVDFEVVAEVRAVALFEDCAEGVVVDLAGGVLVDYVRVFQFLVDLLKFW